LWVNWKWGGHNIAPIGQGTYYQCLEIDQIKYARIPGILP